MKDALGSYFNLTLLFFFILLVAGFIAFASNYSKAYRMKNFVLSNLEKYEGNTTNGEMLDKTYAFGKRMGYSILDDAMKSAETKGYSCPIYQGHYVGWCYRNNPTVGDSYSINIVTFINVNVPVIHQVFANNDFFWMTGRTSRIPIL